jgi:hypothetical protein
LAAAGKSAQLGGPAWLGLATSETTGRAVSVTRTARLTNPAGCHAPHSGARGNRGNAFGGAVTDPNAGNFALWGQDMGPLHGQTITGDEGALTLFFCRIYSGLDKWLTRPVDLNSDLPALRFSRARNFAALFKRQASWEGLGRIVRRRVYVFSRR